MWFSAKVSMISRPPDGKEVAIPMQASSVFATARSSSGATISIAPRSIDSKAGEVPAEHMSALMKREALFLERLS